MKRLIEQHRIRYPPFEAHRWSPASLPIAQQDIELGEFETLDDARACVTSRPPAFRVGDENGWLMERRYLIDNESVAPERNEHFLESEPYVRLVNRQRRGWYLIPNPIHNILRQFINGVVIVLLASLFYLFISPVLELLNIPVYGLDTVRWGLLDYPALAVFVVPLIFAPLVIRVMANLTELRRQNLFLKRNFQTPKIEFVQPSNADENLLLHVEFPEWDESWNHVDAILRVGVLPPGRESLLKTLERDPSRQPPPGCQPNSHTTGRSDWMTARQVVKMHPWKSRRCRAVCSSAPCA